MEKPDVVIILPVYNGAAYIIECLDSIVQQTYTNWTCIINDNKSSDNTVDIVNRYIQSDNRFKLHVNDEVKNQVQNWNTAISRIDKEYKYLKVVCADDWLFPGFLKSTIELMEKYENTGICSSYRIDGIKVRGDGLDIYKGDCFSGHEIIKRQINKELDITGSIHTLIYRLSILKEIDNFPYIFTEDAFHLDTILAYEVLKVSDICFAFEVLSYTRRHNETVTSQTYQRFQSHYTWKDYVLRRFMNDIPELKKYYQINKNEMAYFLLTRWIARDKRCLEFYGKFKLTQLSIKDYIIAFLSLNKLTSWLNIK